MNRLRVWLLIAAFMAIAGAIWVLSEPEQRVAEVSHIQLTSSGHRFCVTNCSASGVVFTLRAIEVRDSQGWTVYTNFVPAIGKTDPMVSWNSQPVEPHHAWYATVTAPPQDLPWRLRVGVAHRAEGVAKLLAWTRAYRMHPQIIRPFSIQQFRAFRSYGRPIEVVSAEVD